MWIVNPHPRGKPMIMNQTYLYGLGPLSLDLQPRGTYKQELQPDSPGQHNQVHVLYDSKAAKERLGRFRQELTQCKEENTELKRAHAQALFKAGRTAAKLAEDVGAVSASRARVVEKVVQLSRARKQQAAQRLAEQQQHTVQLQQEQERAQQWELEAKQWQTQAQQLEQQVQQLKMDNIHELLNHCDTQAALNKKWSTTVQQQEQALRAQLEQADSAAALKSDQRMVGVLRAMESWR